MAAYRADIEIGVRGVRDLEQLRSEINKTGRAVDSLNSVVSARGSLLQNIQNYANNLNRAANSLRLVAAGTEAETKAVREYVRALGEANAARARQNSLVAQEIASKRRVTAGTAPYGQQGPALPPAMVKVQQMQQNWSKFFQEAAQLGQELQTTAAAKALNIRTSWNRFFQEAAQTGQELQADTFTKTARIKTSWNRFFQEAANVAVELQVQAQKTAANIRSQEGAASAAARGRLAEEVARRQRIANAGFGIQGPALPLSAAKASGGGMRGRLGGAVSGSIIGGAFPLLFGQGAGAAAGGAIGGLVGGIAGPGGSFAGSLLGTLLGDIASRGQAVKQLGQDLGFSAQQAQTLAAAFKTANTDVEKFTAVIQNIRGLGLELEDQARLIQLTTKLTANYGGQFDKVGNAITSALEAGKVSQATLNQLTSQGIDIQQALADKLGVSRDQLLDMAKKGKIGIQDLVDVLVDMGNKGVSATKKPASGMEQLARAASGLGSALSALGGAIVKALAPPLNWLAKQLAFVINLAAQGISAMANLLSGGTAATAAANARARQRLAAEGGPSVGTRYVASKYQKRLEQLQKEEQGKIPQLTDKIGKIDVSGLGQAAPAGGGGGGADKAEKAAAREQARVAELIRSQRLITLEYQRQQDFNEKIFAAEMAKDPMLARRLEGERQLVEWGIETADLLEKEASSAGQLAIAKAQQAKQGLIRQKIEQDLKKLEQDRKDNALRNIEDLQNELTIKNAVTQAERDRLRIAYEMKVLKESKQYDELELERIKQLKEQLAAPVLGADMIRQQIGALTDELAKLTDVGTQVTAVAENIGSAFANSFKGAISGAMTAQEALASFFQSVADRFLDMAAQIIAKWIEMSILNSVVNLFPGGGGVGGASMFKPSYGAFEFVPGRAAGGPVSAGSPYMVGERGPELFVPGRSGGIVPNNALGGDNFNVVVNVDASGSKVQGDGAQAGQLAKVVSVAVQQELIKQKRPGGLLA